MAGHSCCLRVELRRSPKSISDDGPNNRSTMPAQVLEQRTCFDLSSDATASLARQLICADRRLPVLGAKGTKKDMERARIG